MSKQIPTFNHQSEIHPLAQLLCERDNLKENSTFGQMLEFVKVVAIIFSESTLPIKVIIDYGRFIYNSNHKLPSFYNKAAVELLVENICLLDEKNEQSNFGQMKELVKELAIILHDHPTYLAALIRYSVHLKVN